MAETEIEIIYHFNDERRESLGTGTIDGEGRINITAPRAGQEEYVKTEMDELNALDYVILKEPPAAGASRFSINKRKVTRDDPDFLTALKNYGMRVYAMEFVFDLGALSPGAAMRAAEATSGLDAAPEGELEPIFSDAFPASDTTGAPRRRSSGG